MFYPGTFGWMELTLPACQNKAGEGRPMGTGLRIGFPLNPKVRDSEFMDPRAENRTKQRCSFRHGLDTLSENFCPLSCGPAFSRGWDNALTQLGFRGTATWFFPQAKLVGIAG